MCKVTLHLCFIIWADPLANVEYLGKKDMTAVARELMCEMVLSIWTAKDG